MSSGNGRMANIEKKRGKGDIPWGSTLGKFSQEFLILRNAPTLTEERNVGQKNPRTFGQGVDKSLQDVDGP